MMQPLSKVGDERTQTAHVCKVVLLSVLISFLPIHAFGLIDLVSYQSPNWNSPLPLGTNQLSGSLTHSNGTVTGNAISRDLNAVLYDNQFLFFNLGIQNIGSTSSGGFTAVVKITNPPNIPLGPWVFSIPSLSGGGGNYILPTDQLLGKLAAGSYELTMFINPSNTVIENNVNNNILTETFKVLHAPTIGVSPSSQDLGAIEVGSDAVANFEVFNSGSGTISGSASVLPPFRVFYGQTYSLGSNQSQFVGVVYEPTTPGTNVATVTFTGGLGTNAIVRAGAYPAPAISVAPSSLNLGTISVGSVSDVILFVTNVGGGMLAGHASATVPFSILSGANYSLPAGKGQQVTIRYTPTIAGSNSSAVTFTGGGGTNVFVAGSAYLPLQSMSAFRSNDALILSWPSSPSGFVLQVKGDLNTTNWINASNSSQTQGTNTQVVVPMTESNVFFRLIRPNP